MVDLKQQKKWERLTKRSVPPFVSFNLHQIWNWLHFQAYYCHRRGSVALQGHEPHPCVPEWALGIRMQGIGREWGVHLTPIVSVFGHISLSQSWAGAKLHSFSISMCQRQSITPKACTQEDTLWQNVIATWVHHLHQECCGFQKGRDATHTRTHSYISVFHLGILRCASLSSVLPLTVWLLWHLTKAKQTPVMSAFSIHTKKKL